jgi:transcriptional regulator with PAS, ATPase and Fis domain
MPTCDIVIDDESVSRQHAVIHNTPPNLLIEDLGSRNRTKILGRALGRGDSAVLAVGTVVEIGYASMFVQVGRPAAPPTSAVPSTKPSAVIRDPTMQRLYALLDVIAPSPLNVLILGETGTGKEVFAEAIHRGSARAHAPFLRINCASLSGSLLESELFGHERGAFTGAVAQKSGLFEAADGGTVFLDEIGELPIETQAKLLRVVEYGEVIRLGSVTPKRVNVRYVAATNRDLNQSISEQRFRSDLFFRLNGFSITLPPLRKRKKDIEPLAHHFLSRAAQGRPYALMPDALASLEGYPWPGNIRELKNVLERAHVLAGAAGRIDTSHLQLPTASMPASDPFDVRGPSDTMPPQAIPGQIQTLGGGGGSGADLRAQRDSFEKQQILQALEKTSGNQKEAAKLLGVSRRTLINKIEAYGIARPRKRS